MDYFSLHSASAFILSFAAIHATPRSRILMAVFQFASAGHAGAEATFRIPALEAPKMARGPDDPALSKTTEITSISLSRLARTSSFWRRFGKDLISAFSLGVMFGWKDKTPGDAQGISIGIGAVLDDDVKSLADGFEAGKPLPAGETEIRFVEKSRWSGILFFTRTF